jgi:hypothetical protein
MWIGRDPKADSGFMRRRRDHLQDLRSCRFDGFGDILALGLPMNANAKAFGSTLGLFAIAIVLCVTAEAPIDSYLEEHVQECVLNSNCPIVEWAPGADGYLVVPRQVQFLTHGAGSVLLRPEDLPILDVRQFRATRHAAAMRVLNCWGTESPSAVSH